MKKKRLIELILKYGIIKTNFKEPITFKSGIRSPIYCNFRECAAHPDLRELIIESFKELFEGRVDFIFGVPIGALPYSEIVAKEMGLPSGYVRPDAKIKDHGLKKLIEGYDDISGKRGGLIEDLVSTSGSIVSNALILQKYGVQEILLASIFSYEMERSKKELTEAGFILRSLITIQDILPYLKESLSEQEYESLLDWVRDPEGWFERHKLEFDFGFLTRLRQSAINTGSIICMGLDPVIEALPKGYTEHRIDGFYNFLSDIFADMKDKGVSPAMFKPNLPWWLKYDNPRKGGGTNGTNALANTMDMIEELFPGVPINIDCKSGDIGTSSTAWAEYIFEKWMPSAMTVHTYMGSDSVGPFIAYSNKEKQKGTYLLVKTTNKGADDVELKKLANGLFVYEQVAEHVINWAKGKPGVGAVTAGNSPAELMVLGKMFAGKDVPLLIPGVGPSQGGDAKQITEILDGTGLERELRRLNLSSGITHPWYKPGKPNPTANECIDTVVSTIKQLNEQVALA